jgi:hypothetical protein
MIEQVLGDLRGGFGRRVEVMLEAHYTNEGRLAGLVGAFAIQVNDGLRFG